MHDRASRCGIRWGELRWADSGGRTRMSKRDLSEADICAKFITPHVEKAGWDDATQIRREVHFTKGQIHVRGKMVTRGKSKFADYIIYYKPNIPIAIIEAKENNHAVGDGMQQALEYAEVLNIPFVFSSNGDGFVFHDRTGTLPAVETTLPLGGFPSPARLWAIYRGWKGLSADQEHVVLQDYFDDGSERQPRYYQRNAINAATEAIAKGQNRLLLVMPPAPARRTRRFRSSGGSGRPTGRSGCSTSPTATSSSTKPWSTTSAHSAPPWRSSTRRPGRSRARTARPTRSHQRSTGNGGSTRRTRSTSACTRRSPVPRSDRSCSASSRPGSST